MQLFLCLVVIQLSKLEQKYILNRKDDILKRFCGAFLLLLISASSMLAQLVAGDQVAFNINAMALIDTNHATVDLELTTSTPGEAIASSDSNTDLWMRVTCVNPGNTKRKVTAKISGTVPSGTILTLISAPATTANSAGGLGDPGSSPIKLTPVDQDLVRKIKSCYTGNSAGDGYQLTLNWAHDPLYSYSLLDSDESTTVTLYLTISAADGNN